MIAFAKSLKSDLHVRTVMYCLFPLIPLQCTIHYIIDLPVVPSFTGSITTNHWRPVVWFGTFWAVPQFTLCHRGGQLVRESPLAPSGGWSPLLWRRGEEFGDFQLGEVELRNIASSGLFRNTVEETSMWRKEGREGGRERGREGGRDVVHCFY